MKRWWIAIALLTIPVTFLLPGQGQARIVAQPAFQSRVNASNPSISATPTSGKPGETITVQGTGFACHSGNAVARLDLNGTVVNSGAPISCNGTFTATFRIPDVAVGQYTITARGYAPQSKPAPQPTDTDTPVPPTATDTPVPPTATSTATAVPPTATSTPVPTNTPVPSATSTPTPTNTPSPTPTNTPSPTNTPAPTAVIISFPSVPTSTPTPTPVPPTATPSPSPTPTCTFRSFEGFCCTPSLCGFERTAQRSPRQPAADRVTSPSGATLVFDGDQASVTLSVTAPSAPYTVTQSLSCPTPPTVGIQVTCTITETVTNPSGHTIAFSSVTNRLAANVKAGTAAGAKGTARVSGQSITWSTFRLAPGGSTSAHIQVTFTPSAGQVGHRVLVSVGLAAVGTDVVTGQRFGEKFGMLQTRARVLTKAQAALYLPSTGLGGTSRRPGSPRSLQIFRLPSTGGGHTGS